MSKVSVIIPIYNGERYLKDCLDSVLSQTLRDIEVLCINDGSTDNSLTILDKYKEIDNRIKIINQDNMGMAVARNKAMVMANSEFICFMDADDLYPSNDTLEILYKHAIKQGAKICGGSMRQFDESGSWENFEGVYKKYSFNEFKWIDFKDYQFNYGYQRFIFNRKMLIDNEIFFPLYKRYQDPPFFTEAMLQAKRFYAIPVVTYCYRLGHQSNPLDWPIDKFTDMIRGWLENLEISSREGLAELHYLVLNQVEDNYTAEALVKNLEDDEVQSLLIKLNASIDIDLLREVAPTEYESENYILRVFHDNIAVVKSLQNQLIEYNALQDKLHDIEFRYNEMENSVSFRCGRMITYIPRLIRNGIRCYRDNGFAKSMNIIYTRIERIFK